MDFTDFNLKRPIADAVAKAKYKEPSPIQERAIPVVMEGRDLIGCAQTGTGKTAAFALPILDRLEMVKGHRIRALVLTPTRELAIQIFENFKKYGRYLKLRTVCIYGGAKQGPQVAALRMGCDILVATPGRLQDFMDQGLVSLKDIEIFVLDEADRMLDMGFIRDVRNIVPKMPSERQTLMFSATMPPEIEALADELLRDPEVIKIAATTTPAETVDQKLCFVDRKDKKELLAEMLREPRVKKAIIFTRTKHGADRLVRDLDKRGVEAIAIHGDKTQGQRQNALQRFSSGNVKFLVATDVAARGLDIPKVSHVFNYELPMEPESYIHRIGRAGRAGATGEAFSFCSEEELDLLYDLEKMMDREIPEMLTDYSIALERKVPAKAGKRSGGRGRGPAKRRGQTKDSGNRQERRSDRAAAPESGRHRTVGKKRRPEGEAADRAREDFGEKERKKTAGTKIKKNAAKKADRKASETGRNDTDRSTGTGRDRKKERISREAARAFSRKQDFKISEEEGNQIRDDHGFWMVDWKAVKHRHAEAAAGRSGSGRTKRPDRRRKTGKTK